MTPAVFLDRDGVLIEEANYLARVEQVRLLPGAAAAVARLNRLGVPVVVVTNQAGVARGLFPEERVGEIHTYLDLQLLRGAARVNRYEFCPHHPQGEVAAYRMECECRKPRPGMILRAAAKMGLDLARSVLVGDKVSDLEAGARAGCRTVLVRTGHGAAVDAATLEHQRLGLLGVVPSLVEAVPLCLARLGRAERVPARRAS